LVFFYFWFFSFHASAARLIVSLCPAGASETMVARSATIVALRATMVTPVGLLHLPAGASVTIMREAHALPPSYIAFFT